MRERGISARSEQSSSKLTQIGVAAFVCSGAVFLLFPDQHYNEQGWGVLVKYAILAILLASLAFAMMFSATRVRAANLLLFLLWQSSLLPALLLGQDLTRVALYALPATALLMPESGVRSVRAIIVPVIWVAFGAAVYEIFVLGGFPRFDVLPQRYVSVFVNPNGLGVTIAILLALAFSLGSASTPKAKVLLTLAVTFLIAISQSKTGMILFGVYASIIALRRFPVTTIVAASALSLALAGALAFQVNGMSIASSLARLEQSATAFSSIRNAIFPFITQGHAALYVDNAFLQSWVEVGLFAPLLFASALVLAAYRDGAEVPIWLLLALSALTTNVLYIVPVAYIAWFYIGLPGRNLHPRTE